MANIITGNEAFWGNLKISQRALDLINASPRLVTEILDYGTAFGAGKIGAMTQGATGAIAFNPNGIVFSNNYQTWTPEMLVGNLAHEIGHYMDASSDAAYRTEYTISSTDPNAYGLNAMIGLHQEGEAVENNYVVQQEILKNTKSQIYLAGEWTTDTNGNTVSSGLQALLDKQHSLDVAAGTPDSQDTQWMIEDAMGVYSALKNSITNEPYFEYYGKANGARPPAPGTITGATFSDPNASGNITSIKETFSSGDTVIQQFNGAALSSSVTTDQFGNVLSQTLYSHNADGSYVATMYDGQGQSTGQDQFHNDGSQVDYVFNADGTQTAYAFDTSGHETGQTTFNANGAKTQDLFFDATSGRETQENDYNVDGSQIDHVFNADGTQTAYAFNASGHETGQATFGANGTKTQDLFYDATSGSETQENDYNADGSQIDHLFNANGTQTSYVFNATGHQTEQATFGVNGQLTQDLLFDPATGRETQENDINADGSRVHHLFNADGTQTSYAFNPAGHETEQATFGTTGKMTQDLFYDATSGRLTQENDINTDGSQVDHVLNADGTQTSYAFNAAGHETEQTTFSADGAKTQDVFYDATSGRETQENDFNADGSQVDHLFNTNGTQTAYVFNAAGHQTEQATFGNNGQITQDIVFDGASGRELQETDYNSNGSGVAHIFNPDGTQNAAIFDPSGHVSEYATYATNGKMTTDAFYDINGRETQLNEYSENQTTVHIINADNSQTATVYNGANQQTEFARFDSSGRKTDDHFYNGPTGKETEYDHYGSDGSMTSSIFHSDNSQDLIIYGPSGLETQYQSYNGQGQLTGSTEFTYTVGGGYNAIAYGPTGFETGWADYGSNGTQLSAGGGTYDFTLDYGYGSGTDWGFTYDLGGTGYSSDYGFHM